jgi:hypothetical protein
MKLALATMILIVIAGVSAFSQQTQKKSQPRDVTAEVMPVLELPLNIHEAALAKTDRGYVLRCRISSTADVPVIGLRYSLTAIEAISGARPITNRIEGFELAAFGTKTFTFQTPIKFRPKDGSRIVLMLEQVLSADSIWEVIKAKDVLEAYVKGDYSIQPHVMRVPNQVDAPLQTRVIY